MTNHAKEQVIAGVVLEGAKVNLQPFGEQHLNDPSYLAWLHDHDVIRTLYLRDYLKKPVSFVEVSEYVTRLINSETDLFLAMHDTCDGQFVGTVKAGHIDWDASIADIGIMIGNRSVWGRGFASDAIYTLCRFLFEELAFRRLTAGAMGINGAMIHVFKKLGFQQEGVFRDQDRTEDGYCDHVYLGCFASELISLETIKPN